jgi:hypothetical protein
MHGTVRFSETTQSWVSPRIAALALCLIVAAALSVSSLHGGVFDAMSTDDSMRLVEVRDLLGGQSWFDLTQYRLDPPGSLMHWSRIIDAPLAGLMLALRPLLGVTGAEAATLILWPTLLFGAALVLVAAIAGRMAEVANRNAVQLAAMLIAALSAPALIHFRAGAIDHHNAQIVLLLGFVLCAGALEQSRGQACLAALSAALSLAIGLEMLPAIAVGCIAILGLAIWRGEAVARQVAAFGAALAGASVLLALILLRPDSLSTPVFDAFGGPVLLLSAGGGISLVAVGAVSVWRPGWPARLATAVVSGGVVLGAFYWLFAGHIASPYAAVDPLVASIWLDHVEETMSFPTMWQLEPQKILGFYGFPALTLVMAVIAIMRTDPQLRFRWIVASAVLAALFGISLWEMRGAAGATLIAAPIFAASLPLVWHTCKMGQRLLIAALLLSPANFAITGLTARPLIDRIVGPHWTVATQDSQSTCRAVSSVAPLAQLPQGRIMAPIDLGPGILATTGHSVFAAPYHRNNDGNLAMIQLMMANPDSALQMLRQRQAGYVVLCRGSLEQSDLVALAPDGLAARLTRGEVPPFLEPVDLHSASQISAWRVR